MKPDNGVTDEELIRKVQRGERSAFLPLFDRHYPRVEGYARRWLGNAEAARDVASETFLRAYGSVDGFRLDQGISYLGYLLMICRRLLITETGRLRRAPMRPLDDCVEAERLADFAPPPIAIVLDAERRVMVREALDCLSEDDREIITLAYERGLSRNDIAVIMDKPSITAVTSHLYRAMQKLRGILERQGYFDFPAPAPPQTP